MSTLSYHPDGQIIVGDYMDTPQNFAADFGEAAPELPAGVVSAVYAPAGVSYAIDATGSQRPFPWPVPWDLADRALAADLLGAQSARRERERVKAVLRDLVQSYLGREPAETEVDETPQTSGYQAWYAEHGGDALLTARRLAKEALDRQAAEYEALLRALALVTLYETNLLREWITAFKAATAAATNLANLQTRVAATPNAPERTAQQLRAAIMAKIDAGDADS